jgi:hydrogenase maturation protein HypF
VQGVGFRPHVHRLATELGLAGYVLNDAEGVLVEAEGPPGDLDRFASRLVADAPPLAVVERVESSELVALGEAGFRIVTTRSGGPVQTIVPPDVAVCDECLGELSDPADRRYRYPFVNCTNCGPRFTIITGLPYDRASTTMAGFPLCADCAAEYADPADRRFHAEPVACPACGPRLWFEAGDPGGPGWAGAPGAAGAEGGGPWAGGRGAEVGGDLALAAAQVALASGRVVAVKGIGGYHLACSAGDDIVLATLRERKGRRNKPFAVMARDLEVARRLGLVGETEAGALLSAQRPIVLLLRHPRSPLGELVAPGNPRVGVMLPYSPLHHLLFAPVPGPGMPDPPEALVMTSGNASEEPICFEDGDARRRLARLADDFLLHDRPIHLPCDDSVVAVENGSVVPVRRSRGYAPLPLRLPVELAPVVAFGGELKSTACVASGRQAFMSQHIGDMGSLETLAAHERIVAALESLYEVSPRVVAADTHPGYHSRRLAAERAGRAGLELELVQHHHAHAAAVMAEHGVPAGERVVAACFDGTGYGEDGAIWGGEILLATYEQAERAAHLAYAPLPGGDAAVRKPYRAALAYLYATGIGWDGDLPPVQAAPAGELGALERQLERQVGCVPASSIGRLFDAVASITGLRHVATYEAQPAIELEGAALAWLGVASEAAPAAVRAGRYRFGLAGELIDPAPVLHEIVADVRAGRPAGEVAAGFHHAVAAMITEVTDDLCGRNGLDRVALTGGVFQNLLLTGLARAALERRGRRVLTHRAVPCNDGGLALGQAVVAGCRAAHRLAGPGR